MVHIGRASGDTGHLFSGLPLSAQLPEAQPAPSTASVNDSADAWDETSYSLVDDDVPIVLLHVDHQIRRLRIEVFDANSGQAWHQAFSTEYLSRNSTANSFFSLGWDGSTANGRRLNVVPNGDYIMVLSIQKALADDNNPAHWERWTSPQFTIARPESARHSELQ